MIVLGIDPGTKDSAYCLFDATIPKILEFGKVSNKLIKGVIFDNVNKVDYIAIEGIVSYGMPIGQKTLFTLFMIGRWYEYCINLNFSESRLFIVSRQNIKMQHCKRTAKVTDGNIRQALIDKYGEQGTKNKPNKPETEGFTYGLAADTWSAFAICSYVSETIKEFKSIYNLAIE